MALGVAEVGTGAWVSAVLIPHKPPDWHPVIENAVAMNKATRSFEIRLNIFFPLSEPWVIIRIGCLTPNLR